MAAALVSVLAVGCSGHSRPAALPVIVPASSIAGTPTSSATVSAPPAPVSSASAIASSASLVSPSSSGSAVGSDSTTGPFGPDPAAARRAAEQVVHDYYAAINTTIRSGKTIGLEESFLPTCALCAREIAAYRTVFDVGNALTDGLIVVNNARAVGVGQSNVITVRTSITEAAGTVVDKKGAVVRSFPSSTNPNLLVEVKITTTGRLIVADIGQLATS
jgi:hypothetical protein